MMNTILGLAFAAIAVAWELSRTPEIKRGKSFIVFGSAEVDLKEG
jgi:hypothetical protein